MSIFELRIAVSVRVRELFAVGWHFHKVFNLKLNASLIVKSIKTQLRGWRIQNKSIDVDDQW